MARSTPPVGTLRLVNPRQRRAVLLLILSFVGLVVVFVLVSGYVSDVRKEVDPKVTVLALRKDAPAFKAVTSDMVQEKRIPERYAPKTALRDPSQIVGFQPATELTAGSILQDGMLAAQPSLQEGQRELAILVDAETGVAGKVTSGSIVDIIATYTGNDTVRNTAEVVVPQARIIDVGQTRVKGGGQDQPDPQQVVPVTFALTPKQALEVQYAESYADEVRLALRRPGDVAKLRKKDEEYQRPKNAAGGGQ
jgi:pilus assembly protein CpaB